MLFILFSNHHLITTTLKCTVQVTAWQKTKYHNSHFYISNRIMLMHTALIIFMWIYLTPLANSLADHVDPDMFLYHSLVKDPRPYFWPNFLYTSKFTWMSAHPGASAVYSWSLKSTTTSAMHSWGKKLLRYASLQGRFALTDVVHTASYTMLMVA